MLIAIAHQHVQGLAAGGFVLHQLQPFSHGIKVEKSIISQRFPRLEIGTIFQQISVHCCRMRCMGRAQYQPMGRQGINKGNCLVTFQRSPRIIW